MKRSSKAAYSTTTVHGGEEDGKKFILVPRWVFYFIMGYLIINGIGRVLEWVSGNG